MFETRAGSWAGGLPGPQNVVSIVNWKPKSCISAWSLLAYLQVYVIFCRIWHMNGIKTSIGEGGRVVLPSAYRKALGVGVGDAVVVTLEDDGLRIMTLAAAVGRSQALVKRYVSGRRSLSRELRRERRREAAGD